MSKTEQQLLLKIQQAGKVVQHNLRGKDRLTIGQHPNNDIIIYGDNFPKRHTLFSKKNNHFQIILKKNMRGEVFAGESRLSFTDLFAHNLLPRSGNNFSYPISHGKKGFVVVGDAKIWFQFVEREIKRQPKFEGYSWTYATFRELGRDLPFKAILIILIVLHGFLLSYMSKLPTDFLQTANAAKVPERLAKIIVRNSVVPETETRSGARAAGSEETEEAADLQKRNRAKKGKEEVRPENQGLLGLLTGTGSSEQSNGLADFLLDEGLVKELEQVMQTSDLQIGKGTGNGAGSNDLDDLFAISEMGGGIDDLLAGMAEVEPVGLSEKGTIQIDRIGSITGSQSALGQRSEASVRRVMLNYQGRLTYIYNKYLKHNPGLSGKVVVEVVIAADGSISNVKMLTSTMNHPEFEREILSFMRRWKYEKIDQGSVTVTYPLFFNKIG